jgi:hypothetical protein
VLRGIGGYLIDGYDRTWVAVTVGAGNQQRTRPQLADSDDG